MPIIDTSMYITSGRPMGKRALKYGNAIDQYGNTVTPNLIDYNLNYDSLFGIMRHHNMIETLERYMWVNLPPGLTQDIVERVLFFRGKGILYYNDNVDKFQFLPFALNGLIDEYGRYLKVNTLPFVGVDETENTNNNKKKLEKFVYEELDVVYDLPYTKDMLERIRNRKPCGIIINDNSLGASQSPVIRNLYVLPVLRILSTLIQIINTAIFGCADHSLIQVQSEAELNSLNEQIEAINQDILHGKRFTGVVGAIPIQPLKTNNTANVEGLFQTFNSMTNFLKSITGIANPGVFDKKAHLLQEEQQLNGSNADDAYYNGLRLRQEACILFQAYYGYPTWCVSKRTMTEEQANNYAMGETDDPDNTQRMNVEGDNKNGNV